MTFWPGLGYREHPVQYGKCHIPASLFSGNLSLWRVGPGMARSSRRRETGMGEWGKTRGKASGCTVVCWLLGFLAMMMMVSDDQTTLL